MRKEAELFKCKYCPREFDNLQARRGHYRACPDKPHSGQAEKSRLKRQEPGIGSAFEPAEPGSKAEICSPTRSTVTSNYLFGMIDAHDLLAILRKRCQRRLPYYKLVDNCLAQDEPGFLDWIQVTTDLLGCEREVGELVQRASVGRDRVWPIYLCIIDVQERWIPWAEREVTHIWRKKETKDVAMTWEDVGEDYGLPELKDHFLHLIDLLRRLTATTRMGI